MKFLNKKRIASAALAGALALSMAAPAFATNTTITGNYNEIKLSVTVPSTGKAIINPYGLPYTLGESTISGEQITTGAALTIQNKSAVGLKVGAKITTTPTNGVTIDTSKMTDPSTENTKRLYVAFEAFPADSIAGDAAADTAVLNAAFAALKSEDAVLTVALDSTQEVTAAKASGKDDLVLREANADGELQKGGAAFFRLAGQAAQGATWAKEDGFTAAIAFTFTPTAYTKPAGTLTTAAQSLDTTTTTTTTATLALNLPDKVTAKKVEWVSAKPTQVEVVDATTGLGTASVAIKANITAKATTSSAVKITVNITGSDGIIYTATTAADQSISVS